MKKILYIILFLICITVLLISTFNIITWYKDSINTKNNIEKLKDYITFPEVNEDIPEEIKKHLEESNTEEYQLPSYYYDYMTYNQVNVKFDELLNINNDTKGWIKVAGTNVNYPFVQTSDNEYYLKHSYDKKGNYAGWIFMDYRNDINNLSKNTIIYGHGRLDKTMFGELRDILSNGWLNNPNNFMVTILTPNSKSLWKIFSVYEIPTTSDYLKTSFTSLEYEKFINMITERSQYNFDDIPNTSDYILTLSTCRGKVNKVVIHAKLIRTTN